MKLSIYLTEKQIDDWMEVVTEFAKEIRPATERLIRRGIEISESEHPDENSKIGNHMWVFGNLLRAELDMLVSESTLCMEVKAHKEKRLKGG